MSSSSQSRIVDVPNGASSLSDQTFFIKMSIALAVFIVISFVQWSLRGFVDVYSVPWWVHAHGAFMLLWLLVLVTQNILAARRSFDLHRQLGWTSMIVVFGVVIFGSAAGLQALALHRKPPFFTNAYFLALTQIEVLLFLGTVTWAIAKRRDTQWHRRLMLGATVLLLEPALGRLLPMSLLGAMGEWIVLVVQLLPLVILAMHDRATMLRVHPATSSAATIAIVAHLTVTLLAELPAFVELANNIAGQ